jgi:membrane protein YdbS with pleckstrin-like domain
MEPDSTDSIADGVSRQLDPRWITVRRIHNVITAAVLSSVPLAGVIGIWIASQTWFVGLLLLPVWAVLMAALAWQLYRWPPISYRFTSYRLDNDGLEILRGVYWRTVTNVPRSRVQHTDVSQGPLERRHGLGTLLHSRVTLPGLEFSVARRIRTHLLPRDRVEDAGDAV